MKNIIILFHLFLILFVVYGCELDGGEVKLNFQLQKTNYNVADTLRGSFTVSNFTSEDITYQFSSSCEYNLYIKNGDAIVRYYPELCAQIMLRVTLKEYESKTYDIEIPLIDSNYNNLNKGIYTVEISVAYKNSRVLSRKISID